MDDLLRLHLHHGGLVIYEDIIKYKGGQVTVYPNEDPDKFSLPEFEDIIKELGYITYDSFWYKEPLHNEEKGLIALMNDQDVHKMLGAIQGFKDIHVYVGHTNSNVPCVDEVQIEKDNVVIDDDTPFVGTNSETDSADESDADKFFKIEREGPLRTINIELDKEIDWDALDSESEELRSLCDSSEDDHRAPYSVFKDQLDPRDTKFQVGQLFQSMDKFKEAINDYSVYNHKNVQFVKNEKHRLRAQCAKGCPFLLYASLLPDEHTVQIKTFVDKHTCTRLYHNQRLSSKWIAKNIVGTVRAHPNIPAVTLQATISERWGLRVSKSKAARARRFAKKIVEGDHKEQFMRVRDYCMEVLRANPGSSCLIHAEQPPCAENTSELLQGTFPRMYMCLEACKRGFIEGCRRFIGLDGCHLKGPCAGILLAAVGVDTNNQIFPIAIAICEGETKDSWIWFLERLADDLDIQSGSGWTVISDQQKGLLPALMRVMPSVQQRFCVRHMYSNFRKQHPGLLLKDTMWRAARATYLQAFEIQMTKLKELSNGAWEWLSRYEARLWSRSGFSTDSKCDMLLNNISESFNVSILGAREKPIITLMECFRESVMLKFQANREKIQTWRGLICPRVIRKLEKIKSHIGEWTAKYEGDDLFEIQGFYHKYKVALKTRTCSCRKWEISGISCVHAVVAIFDKNDDVEKYIDECYYIDTYKKCYKYVVGPINGADMWPCSDLPGLLPPKYNRAPGRPKKARRKDPNEKFDSSKLSKKYQQQKCTKCKQFGHNKRGCVQPNIQTVQPHVPRNRGRPRKATSTGPRSTFEGSTSAGCPTRHRRNCKGQVGTQESSAQN